MYVCSGVLTEAVVRFLPLFYLSFGTVFLRGPAILSRVVSGEPHAHLLPVIRVIGACCHSGLFMGAGNLNSVIHICAAGCYPLSHLPDLHTDKFVQIPITVQGPTMSNL